MVDFVFCGSTSDWFLVDGYPCRIAESRIDITGRVSFGLLNRALDCRAYFAGYSEIEKQPGVRSLDVSATANRHCRDLE